MERAVFGASEFFSKEAFITFRGVEYVEIGQVKGTNLDLVEIWFDPWKVSYTQLVELFFDLHDPTIGEDGQWKKQSFIFFSTIDQLVVAKQKKNELKRMVKNEVITEITPVGERINRFEEFKLIS